MTEQEDILAQGRALLVELGQSEEVVAILLAMGEPYGIDTGSLDVHAKIRKGEGARSVTLSYSFETGQGTATLSMELPL